MDVRDGKRLLGHAAFAMSLLGVWTCLSGKKNN